MNAFSIQRRGAGVAPAPRLTMRTIDESAMLLRHMAEHVRESDAPAAERFMGKARDAERRSQIVRRAVFDHENLGEEKVAEPADTV